MRTTYIAVSYTHLDVYKRQTLDYYAHSLLKQQRLAMERLAAC